MRLTVQTLNQLGDLLRSRRKQLGLTQAAIASRLGVSQEWVATLERSPGQMSVTQLMVIVESLDLVLDLIARPGPSPGGRAEPGRRP